MGLSFVLTLLLMVIHWEPQPSLAPSEVQTAPPTTTPAVADDPPGESMAGIQPVKDAWVMQDAADVEGLPDDVRMVLFDTGCLIPFSADSPNVIWGELKQAGQTDLAVLCIRDQRAAVYVFWGGNPAETDISTELDFIAGTSIRAARADDIRVEVTRDLPLDPGMPRRIRHDGIQVGVGCCTTTQYWHRGRWRSYVSAD
jgi:hypothetical protein